MDDLFAVATPGLESIALGEMQGLGLSSLRLENGGISFQGNLKDILHSNLHLRTVSRILVRIGQFHASAFSELRKKSSRLPWEKYLVPGQPVSIRATSHKSRLYHSDAIIERVVGAIGDHLGSLSTHRKSNDLENSGHHQLIIVRLVNDDCIISIDSSGESLHRRGYRLATAKAPLRETLAAAILLASGWKINKPLIDPFCGSGTIPIEAALLALNIPPGMKRKFAFMSWPNYPPSLWDETLSAIRFGNSNQLPPIFGSDRDAGAIEMAIANAGRSGVVDHIQFICQAVSAISPPVDAGWIITNPPYGLRVKSNKDLRNLYAQFGNVLRNHCHGWNTAILCSDQSLLSQVGVKLDKSIRFANGGINVVLGRGSVDS
jgi:putative N6-adenine-specific DNA methylase